MGRRPKGQEAMSDAERSRLKRAREAERLERLQRAADPERFIPDSRYLKVEHLRLDPDRTTAYLVHALGPEDAARVYTAFGRALGLG